MVFARQARLGGVGKHLSNNGPQRVLHQEVVANQIGGHGGTVEAWLRTVTERQTHCKPGATQDFGANRVSWRLR